jgi:GntR family transcriptional regulator/MocR family aminotransferase
MLEQAVLADFISEGHYIRHLRRMRTLYAERRNALLEAAKNLPLEMFAPEAGIHCVGWLPAGMNDRELTNKAKEYDLELTPISAFRMQHPGRAGLLLGYGGHNVQEIKKAARRLGALLDSIRT